MAESPSHKFGQIVGDVLEAAVKPLLTDFARQHGLYLDQKGLRPCRAGLKCSWKDLNGNSHDLDFVLERGGTPTRKGIPAAFIEVAWRRYTKHSRNKAQEIQGAIVPLVETYQTAAPFKGAILAGDFTDGALNQLRSLGFSVLYFPYASVITAFRQYGIDAKFDERTPDSTFAQNIEAYESLPDSNKASISEALVTTNAADVTVFLNSLSAVVLRQIERIIILPLHGSTHDLKTIDEAITFLNAYNQSGSGGTFHHYEIIIRYNNGNEIIGKCKDKESAIDFLKKYEIPKPS